MPDFASTPAQVTNVRDERPPTFGSRPAWAKGVLWAIVAICVVALISGWLESQLLKDIAAGNFTQSEADASDDRQAAVALTQFAIFVLSAITFILWLHRATVNVQRITGTEPKYRPRWAIWGFIIPILSFWRPIQMLEQAWVPGRGSDVPWLIPTWWILFVLSSFYDRVVANMPADTISELQDRNTAYLVSDVASIVIALLAIAVVSAVTRRQLELGGGTPGPHATSTTPTLPSPIS
jgi:hypothetical protein